MGGSSGWAIESIGGNIAVGFLTTATLLPTNSIYTPEPGSELCADAEAAVELAAPIDPAGSVGAVLDDQQLTYAYSRSRGSAPGRTATGQAQ